MNALKILKSLGVVALGMFIAQLVTVSPVQAQDGKVDPPGGGCVCVRAPNWICSDNGVNYADHRLECN
jgi:hypothetical protein